MQLQKSLPGASSRAKRMRLDTASMLKRFFFIEKSLVIAQSAWLAKIPQFEVKTLLPRMTWEDAVNANELRERVFELHYPSRLMNMGDNQDLIDIVEEAIHAPSPEAFILSLAEVFKPALLAAYQQYLDEADEIADGPTIRFLNAAVADKGAQVDTLRAFADEMNAQADDATRTNAREWSATLGRRLAQIGGITLDEALPLQERGALPGHTEYHLPEVPARDKRFYPCQFYWPDVIVPNYPYGEGLRLQLRSAVSHVNEVWAVEAAGAAIHAFADLLGWDFVHQAARWCYDESRHARMGFDRLQQWGIPLGEVPLGTYIYDSTKGQHVLYLLGMLAYFETKNIGKKSSRAKAFSEMNDSTSQHDMEFDWADETLHAHYGATWLEKIHELRPEFPDYNSLKDRCNELVADLITTATDVQRAEITAVAEAMLRRAEGLSIPV